MANIDTLVQDVYDVVTGVSPKGEAMERTKYFQDLADAYASLIVPRNKERTPNTLYFSEIGQPCKRKLWYKINHKSAHVEELQAHTRIKFGYGHMLEALVLQLARDAGHTVEMEQEKVEWKHSSGWRVSGRIDAVIDGVLVDVKSVSKLGKKKFEDGLVDDPFGYKQQLNGYAVVLKNPSSGFLTIEKELGHINYYPTAGYNTKAWDTTVELAVAAVTHPTAPDRVYDGVPQSKTSKNLRLPTMCSYCEYKHECWQDANGGDGLRGFAYAGKIEWLTEVVDTPRVPEIDYEEIKDVEA